MAETDVACEVKKWIIQCYWFYKISCYVHLCELFPRYVNKILYIKNGKESNQSFIQIGMQMAISMHG